MKPAKLTEAEAREFLPADLLERIGLGSGPKLVAVKTPRAPRSPAVSRELAAVVRAAEDLLREGMHGVFNAQVVALADAVAAARTKGGF